MISSLTESQVSILNDDQICQRFEGCVDNWQNDEIDINLNKSSVPPIRR